jgi:hypothetical protein
MADRRYYADRLRLIPDYTVFEASTGRPYPSMYPQRNLIFGDLVYYPLTL